MGTKNRLGFNEDKSRVMLLTRRKRKEKKEIAVFINNKKLNQVNQIRYLAIFLTTNSLSANT